MALGQWECPDQSVRSTLKTFYNLGALLFVIDTATVPHVTIAKNGFQTKPASQPDPVKNPYTPSPLPSSLAGDRNCARACISRPDIRTFEVPPGENARIIIASDGVCAPSASVPLA